jgi:putative PIN family toxin of toxin-antitoxin system
VGKEKIVLDTNILISAFRWDGKPEQALKKAADYEIIIAKKQMEELVRVLEYPKFGFSKERKSEIIDLMFSAGTLVETHGHIQEIKEDPDDDMILEAAVENGARYIITGDRHLLALREYQGVKIVTAEGFLRV